MQIQHVGRRSISLLFYVFILVVGAGCGLRNVGIPIRDTEVDCTDGLDDDADGLTDCEDFDCAADPGCAGGICGDGVQDLTEQCDGQDFGGRTCVTLGFEGGVLGCTEGCLLDTSACQGPGTCGNGVREGVEECDGGDLAGEDCRTLGFSHGALWCSPSCLFDTSGCQLGVCGNDVVEGTEDCDGADLNGQTCLTLGYDRGALSCRLDCRFDETDCHIGECGNGVVEGSEPCDGADLGGKTCQDVGFQSGGLACGVDCTWDTSGCTGFLWYFHEDFETGAPLWSLGGDWQVGTPSAPMEPEGAFDGASCAGTVMGGPYSDGNRFETCTLVTPEIDLTAATSPVLRYYQFVDTESGFDGGTLWIRTDANWNWSFIGSGALDPHYNEQNIGGLAGYGGEIGLLGWHGVTADLSDYVGHRVQLRFSFHSDESVSQGAGWYVDEVLVTEPAQVPLTIETGEDLGVAILGEPFSNSLQVTGGDGDVGWSIVSGSNHGWLSVAPDTGLLSGTPGAGQLGVVTFTVRAEQVGHPENHDEKSFFLEVVEGGFNESFDGGLPPGWTFGGDWQYGTPGIEGPPGCHGGSAGCAGTVMGGDYNDSNEWSDCALVSPAMDLSGMLSPRLLFHQYYEIEPNWDGGAIWVSVDGGASWEVVDPGLVLPSYDVNGVGNPGDEHWAYSGYQAALGWHEVEVDLHDYNEANVRIRFSFFSDPSVAAAGWYIDDVKIVE